MVTRPHVAFYHFYAPFLISRRTDATSDLAPHACSYVPEFDILYYARGGKSETLLQCTALNSDNVSRDFDLFLPFSFSSSALSLSLYFPSSASSSLPLAYLSFCSFPSPSLFPHFSPCRQRRRIMNRDSVSDTKALPAMTTPRIVLVSKFDITRSRVSRLPPRLMCGAIPPRQFRASFHHTRAVIAVKCPCKNTHRHTRLEG